MAIILEINKDIYNSPKKRNLLHKIGIKIHG